MKVARDVALFYKMKQEATQALKNWATNVIRDVVDSIPKSVDTRFN